MRDVNNLKSIWEMHFAQEIAHLHKAAELLSKHENKDYTQIIGEGSFPQLLKFHDTKEYVRKILAEQIELTADKEDLRDVNLLPVDHTFFAFQNKINSDVTSVASHVVIDMHIKTKGEDYRAEMRSNPVEALQNRKEDNYIVGRTKQRETAII